MSTADFWRHALQGWDGDTALDLHQFFGIDLLDDAVLSRPWWWLRVRIRGLLDIPSSRMTRWLQEAAQ